MGQHTPLTRAVFKRLYTVAVVLGIMTLGVNVLAVLLAVGVGWEHTAVTNTKAAVVAAGGTVLSHHRLHCLRVSPGSGQ